MIKHDPMNEWEDAIKTRAQGWIAAVLMFAFVCSLVAPLFSPWIKHLKRREYVLYSDYEMRAEADMKIIRPMLWIIAIIAWAFLIYCNVTR